MKRAKRLLCGLLALSASAAASLALWLAHHAQTPEKAQEKREPTPARKPRWDMDDAVREWQEKKRQQLMRPVSTVLDLNERGITSPNTIGMLQWMRMEYVAERQLSSIGEHGVMCDCCFCGDYGEDDEGVTP